MQQVARQEKKYLTDVASATRLRGRLRHVLHEDEQGGADGYRVRSLYFDTVNDAITRRSSREPTLAARSGCASTTRTPKRLCWR